MRCQRRSARCRHVAIFQHRQPALRTSARDAAMTAGDGRAGIKLRCALRPSAVRVLPQRAGSGNGQQLTGRRDMELGHGLRCVQWHQATCGAARGRPRWRQEQAGNRTQQGASCRSVHLVHGLTVDPSEEDWGWPGCLRHGCRRSTRRTLGLLNVLCFLLLRGVDGFIGGVVGFGWLPPASCFFRGSFCSGRGRAVKIRGFSVGSRYFRI